MIQLLIILALDFYVFSGLLSWFKSPRGWFKKAILIVFWLVTIISYAVPMYYRSQGTTKTGQFPYSFIFAFFLAWFLVKLTYALVLLINDIYSLIKFAIKKNKSNKANIKIEEAEEKVEESTVPTISRSQFLLKTGALVAAAPAVAMTVGITSGAHDYRVRRETVKIKDLPKSFHGMTLAQISDIHSGSFWNKTAVKGGVELLMAEKPDLVCFTGDLVNNAAGEMSNYMNVFDKVKAPLGVYSIIGNHDYGNYVRWDSKADKEKNFADFLRVHKNLGWNLMLNENKIFTQGGESLALIGVENWSNNKRFPSTGDLIKAKKGTEEAAAKILMSHDPTHWRAEVLKEHKDIGLTMSGHTHGMQFGIETENFKWSPVQYLYPEWAGLYQEGEQNLYVNRGYGYLGFPGRFGILPEITILTLERA